MALLRKNDIDKVDAIFISSALMTTVKMTHLADAYARGNATYTGIFTKQHIHGAIVKKTVMKILDNMDNI